MENSSMQEVENTENNKEKMPNIIILDQEKGKPVKVTGKQWDMLFEAISDAILQVKELGRKAGKSVTKTIVEGNSTCTLDWKAPKDFSYRDWALVALFCGHMKTSKDIAQFLVEKRLEETEANRKSEQ